MSAGSSVAAASGAKRASQPESDDDAVAQGVVARDGLLETLSNATTRKVTVIVAPPGSGKTSLLRAWSERAASSHRVVFVSVARGARTLGGPAIPRRDNPLRLARPVRPHALAAGRQITRLPDHLRGPAPRTQRRELALASKKLVG
jgi:hypothetical protein